MSVDNTAGVENVVTLGDVVKVLLQVVSKIEGIEEHLDDQSEALAEIVEKLDNLSLPGSDYSISLDE